MPRARTGSQQVPEIAVFCEARADFEAVALLIERVVAVARPWTVGQFDALCRWATVDGAEFTQWTVLKHAFRSLRAFRQRQIWGAGDGEQQQAVKALKWLEYRERKPDAIVLVRDADKGARLAPYQAAAEGRAEVIVGVPIVELESWYLNGFEPGDAAESAALAAARRAVGRDPVARAHTLNPKREHHPASTKRILDALTGGDRDRQRACLERPSLDTLKTRGEASGLAAFIDAVEATIAPLF